MNSHHPNGVRISHVHSDAICEEVAERLRAALTSNPACPPPYLVGLMKRLDSAEGGDARFKQTLARNETGIGSK